MVSRAEWVPRLQKRFLRTGLLEHVSSSSYRNDGRKSLYIIFTKLFTQKHRYLHDVHLRNTCHHKHTTLHMRELAATYHIP